MAQYLDKTGLTTLWTKIKKQDCKPLYNLGAYDTISGNVITRQTGYLKLDGVNVKVVNVEYSHYISFNFVSPNKEAFTLVASDFGVSTTTNWDTNDGFYFNPVGDYRLTLKATGQPVKTINEWNAYFSQNPIYIQYKLATSYTEEIIEGQPLITLDQQGSQWLRDEWEKGLNVLPPSCFYPNNNIQADGSLGTYQNYSCYYKVPVKPNTQYIASRSGGIIATDLGIAMYDNTGAFLKYVVWSGSKGTTENNVYYISFDFLSSYTDIMLNEGSEPLIYKPYNQNKHITNNEAVFLKTEYDSSTNLLDVLNKTITEQGITFTISNGVINVNGSSAASTYPECPINSVELQAGTYTITKSVDNTGLYIWVGSSIRSNDIVNTYSKSANFTITTNMRVYITIVSTQSQTYSNFKFSLMLNEGNKALPYQPYNQNKHITNNEAEFLKTETDRSANLFNNPYNYSGTNNGVSINISGNECVLNGTSTNGFYQTLGSVTLKAGTYTFNHVILSGSINGNISQVRFGLHKGGSELFPLGETTGTYTLTEDTSVDIVVWFGASGMTFNNCKLTFMLNKGSKPLPYQPYEGKIVHEKEFNKIENNLGYYDTIIDNSDGRYTITRQTGYVDLGKLHWIYDPNNNQFYSNEINNAYSENSTWIPVVCNTYTYNIVDYNDLPTPHIRGFFDKRLYVVDETLNQNGELITGVIQYKLKTATTEKVEKNHYSAYNQDFILEHNKSEAERSCNLFDDNGTNSVQYIGHYYTNNSSGYWLVTPHDNYNCFRIRVKPNKTYYIKEIKGLILRFDDINNNLVGGLDLFNIGYGSFTTPNGCEYVVFSKQISFATNVTMFNEGSEPLPYQPYEGKVVHEKDLGDKLDSYVDTTTRQEINGLKRFNSGVALKRDDTGIFQSDDGANLAIKAFGRDLHFYGKSGVENYVANAILSFAYSGENNSYTYTFPQKNGTIALTSDLPTFKTINGNSIVGSGNLSVTADSVFTEVTDVIDSFIINKNGTWLITCLGYNKIYASDNSSISFYGSALVSMTSAGSNPHITINGVAYSCSSAITFVTSGIMQVYKKAN